MNWFDGILLLIIFASFLSGLRTGLARVVLHLMATVVGLIAGFWCYGLVAEKLSPYISSPAGSERIGIRHHLRWRDVARFAAGVDGLPPFHHDRPWLAGSSSGWICRAGAWRTDNRRWSRSPACIQSAAGLIIPGRVTGPSVCNAKSHRSWPRWRRVRFDRGSASRLKS